MSGSWFRRYCHYNLSLLCPLSFVPATMTKNLSPFWNFFDYECRLVLSVEVFGPSITVPFQCFRFRDFTNCIRTKSQNLLIRQGVTCKYYYITCVEILRTLRITSKTTLRTTFRPILSLILRTTSNNSLFPKFFSSSETQFY